MRTIIFLGFIMHALFHLPGFLKAFKFLKLNTLTIEISRKNGIVWLICSIFFLVTGILMILKVDSWVFVGMLSILLSQYLIFTTWHDSKYGTLVNILFLAFVILSWGRIDFEKKYLKEVEVSLKVTAGQVHQNLTESDLLNLPEPVRNYIRYTGCIGEPKVENFKIKFIGKIRKNNESEWMPFTSEQYNFINSSTRLFFMKATMKKLPVAGFHCFKNGIAFMDIRLFSLFKVQFQSGKEMGIAETVTFFNDMCCMAPATLIDKRIEWKYHGGDTVFAKFSNNNISINAQLVFNSIGELTNFISYDRYATSDSGELQKIPWSTPLKNYQVVDGFKLATDASTIYHYPDSDLIYGTFELKEIKYNCNTIQP